MEAVLFYNYVNNVHGAVIDFIEYYLCILKYNKNIKLIIINYNKEFEKIIDDLIAEKYDLKGLNYKKNIKGLELNDIFRIKFRRLLIVDYGTIAKVKGFVALADNKSKMIILSDLHTDDPKYVITKSLYPKDSVLYYGEMPFVYKDIEYTHKFLFDNYKSKDAGDDAILLHVPESEDYSFIKDYPEIFSGRKIIHKTHKPKDDLFTLFNTFVYYHANKWFDPRPRLMHECAFYNKIIHYFNKPKCLDGSFYRYNDLLLNGLSNRYLDDKDEVIQHFI